MNVRVPHARIMVHVLIKLINTAATVSLVTLVKTVKQVVFFKHFFGCSLAAVLIAFAYYYRLHRLDVLSCVPTFDPLLTFLVVSGLLSSAMNQMIPLTGVWREHLRLPLSYVTLHVTKSSNSNILYSTSS